MKKLLPILAAALLFFGGAYLILPRYGIPADNISTGKGSGVTHRVSDPASGTEASITANYTFQKDPKGRKEVLLTDVSGAWTGTEAGVVLEEAVLTYACNGLTVRQMEEDLPVTGPSFHLETGFSTYVPEAYLSAGAELKLRFSKGEETWTMTVSTYNFNEEVR